MNSMTTVTCEVQSLIEAVCDGMADDTQVRDLESLLLTDEEACKFYVYLLDLDAKLQRLVGSLQEGDAAFKEFISAEQTPPRQLAPSPAPTFLSTTLHGTIGFFSQEIPFALLIATVVIGLGFLIGSLITVSHDVQISQQPPPPVAESSLFEKIEYVGHITGMVDCKWADPNTATMNGVNVRLGRKFALASGLMEITYNMGAKVILQGPVTYEVESPAGGFLSLGKLTARVEKRGEGRGERGEGAINPKSKIQNPKFVVKTPTATVTDLGTEFGVEVSKEGTTTSHVFRGSIELQVAASDGRAQSAARVLHENESARVESSSGHPAIVLGLVAKPADFVRTLAKPTIKTFDLVDVVAGGNGFGKARDRGIDPSTGKTLAVPPENFFLTGDGDYHRVEELQFVDGVFIPCTGKEPMQLDSAGHVFAFSDYITDAQCRSWGPIWAGGVLPQSSNGILPANLRQGLDYSAPWHSVLGMHANKGITFDLESIRRSNPQCRILRFLAVAGNPLDSPGRCDVWVFVDGQPRFRRQGITIDDGELKIVVALNNHNRFLTLASTDGGDGGYCDAVIFGDPRLVLEEGADLISQDKNAGRGTSEHGR